MDVGRFVSVDPNLNVIVYAFDSIEGFEECQWERGGMLRYFARLRS